MFKCDKSNKKTISIYHSDDGAIVLCYATHCHKLFWLCLLLLLLWRCILIITTFHFQQQFPYSHSRIRWMCSIGDWKLQDTIVRLCVFLCAEFFFLLWLWAMELERVHTSFRIIALWATKHIKFLVFTIIIIKTYHISGRLEHIVQKLMQ